MRLFVLLVAASLAKADKLPAGSSYLPPTAASNGYGAPQAAYGGGNDDYYDDYEEDQQPSYSEDQVGLFLFVVNAILIPTFELGCIFEFYKV